MSDWVKAYWPRSGESLSARTVSTSFRTSELNSSSRNGGVDVGDSLDRLAGKAPPEHRALLYEPALVGCEGIEARGDEGRQPRWDLELAELADKVQRSVVTFLEDALVEQSPHRLDRVERDPLGTLDDARVGAVREAGDEPVQQLADDLVGKRVERESRDGSARQHESSALGPLRPGQHEEEDGVVARPLEQVVQEVDHAGVGPLQVLDDHDDGQVLGEALEEEAPAREELLFRRAPCGSAARAAGRGGGR